MSVSKFYAALSAFGVAASMMIGTAAAAPVSIDGALGAEWAGATVKSVLYNPLAPIGNFGTPTNENHVTAYDIYTRGDNDYFYVGLTTTGNTYVGALDFANLYFSTTLTGVLNTSANTLTVAIPPTGTAITHFETTITKKKSGKKTYYVMARCKKKKWVNSETTTFNDGTSQSATSVQKCKQKPSKKKK